MDNLLHKGDNGAEATQYWAWAAVGPQYPTAFPPHAGFHGVPFQRCKRPPFIRKTLNEQLLRTKHLGVRDVQDKAARAAEVQHHVLVKLGFGARPHGSDFQLP